MEKTKYYFAILSVLAIIIIISNILIYIELSTQINSLQSRFMFCASQTIYGTLGQRLEPDWGELVDPSRKTVYVLFPTPTSNNSYYLSERGQVLAHLYWYDLGDPPGSTAVVYDLFEERGISVGDTIEVDGLVWYRHSEYTGKTYTMLEWFAIRKG
jgi:hypothetical protein